jgi:Pretoxin HINT domain
MGEKGQNQSGGSGSGTGGHGTGRDETDTTTDTDTDDSDLDDTDTDTDDSDLDDTDTDTDDSDLDGGGCFVSGTLVASSRGMVPIEQIEARDLVYVLDAESKQEALNTVDRTFVSARDEVMTLVFDGDEIRCTPPHRFYTGDWTPAETLRPGDLVMSRNGDWHVLRSVRRDTEPQTVFNLRVLPAQCYLIGNLSLLVHNAKKQPDDEE